MNKMYREAGVREMPLDLLPEDLWLQILLLPNELKVAPDALVEYVPGDLREYPRLIARRLLANEQLSDQYPRCYRRYQRFRSSLSEPEATLSEKVSRAYKKGGLRSVAQRGSERVLRSALRTIFRQQIRDHYEELRQALAESGGSSVLAGLGRIQSSKR